MKDTVTTKFTIPHIINALKQKGSVPKAEIDAALAYGKEAVPALIEVVKDAVENFQTLKASDNSYITAFYILAKMREPQACRYIIQMASLYREWPERLLGDVITEGVASIIVSTYDGNLQAIKNLIEHTHAYLYSRTAALNSLLGLFAVGRLSRQEVVNYFRELLRSPLVNDYEFAAYLLDAVCDLYPRELWDDAMAIFDKAHIDRWIVSKESFREVLDMGMEAALNEYLYGYKFYLPVEEVLAEIKWLYISDDEDSESIAISELSDCSSCDKYGTHEVVARMQRAAAAEEDEELNA